MKKNNQLIFIAVAMLGVAMQINGGQDELRVTVRSRAKSASFDAAQQQFAWLQKEREALNESSATILKELKELRLCGDDWAQYKKKSEDLAAVKAKLEINTDCMRGYSPVDIRIAHTYQQDQLDLIASENKTLQGASFSSRKKAWLEKYDLKKENNETQTTHGFVDNNITVESLMRNNQELRNKYQELEASAVQCAEIIEFLDDKEKELQTLVEQANNIRLENKDYKKEWQVTVLLLLASWLFFYFKKI